MSKSSNEIYVHLNVHTAFFFVFFFVVVVFAVCLYYYLEFIAQAIYYFVCLGERATARTNACTHSSNPLGALCVWYNTHARANTHVRTQANAEKRNALFFGIACAVDRIVLCVMVLTAHESLCSLGEQHKKTCVQHQNVRQFFDAVDAAALSDGVSMVHTG